MPYRGWVAPPCTYLEMSAIVGKLVDNQTLRDIACCARAELRLPFAAVSFGSTQFSCQTSLFVRESMTVPEAFDPCAAISGDRGVTSVSQLPLNPHAPRRVGALRSYAGCPIPDQEGHCVGVFYMMDTKQRRFSAGFASRLRLYAQLIAGHIEILRRFGLDGPEPSAREIVWQADRFAELSKHVEARQLIGLAYVAHDIACLRSQRLTAMLS